MPPPKDNWRWKDSWERCPWRSRPHAYLGDGVGDWWHEAMVTKYSPTVRRWRGVCGCCVTTTVPDAAHYYAEYIGQQSNKVWDDECREKYEAQVTADNEEAQRVDDKLLDRLTRWKLGDPKHKSRRQLKRDNMYRQFTIDLRVDFTDQDKLDTVRQLVAAAGRDLFASAGLLADKGSEPQIAVYSSDSFAGCEDISILENTVQAGREELSAVGARSEDAGISEEMLEAMRDVKFDKSK